MKTEIKIPVRAYAVTLRDARTGEVMNDTVVLEKSRLQAGALFDLADEDIIYRIYNRQGYRVLEIGKPQKVELSVDLGELYTARLSESITDREFIDMNALADLCTEGAELAQEYWKIEKQMGTLLDEARELISGLEE